MNKLELLKKQSEEHAKFRETPQWLVFRKYMLALHNNTCDLCMQHYKQTARLDVHHMFDTNYKRLEEGRFMVLCKTCHKFIHDKARSPAFKHLVHRVDYVTLPSGAHDKKADDNESNDETAHSSS